LQRAQQLHRRRLHAAGLLRDHASAGRDYTSRSPPPCTPLATGTS
jgi:hypothetical protein